ncbi:GGDEF domain-containing protein [Novosphingobium sp. BL-52-GroH]|uniref:GGDEF domain-containing protein n=1 Tax=Novosphingobium sp. BL-52-GroH TaxID=3349877 RepID=UPI00384CB352
MEIDSSFRRACRGLALAFAAALWLCCAGGAALAGDLSVGGHRLCHATSAKVAGEAFVPAFSCAGEPAGYQNGSLWLRADLSGDPLAREEPALLVHNSRFDRLEVTFTYADGARVRQQVRSGDFGSHWRAGAQIAFSAPRRAVPVAAMTLRFDRLASANLLRLQLAGPEAEEQQSTVLAAVIGSALMLLLVGASYNASLAIVARRQFSAWQAGWAACMLVWGACWSQLLLLVLPGMAGAISAQVCTGLACLAVMLATLSAVTAIEEQHLDPRLRRATLALGCLSGALGVPLSLMRSGPIDLMATLLGVVTLAVLVAVATCLAQAWRRGSPEARSFTGAWAVPMLVLGGTSIVDTDHWLWGGGSQLLVLFSAAWQTLWLSISASRAYARLRMQRDMARRAEAQAHELARRDPLTGLRNRRGFFEVAEARLAASGDASGGGAVALMLIDVDFFKSINDVYGHDAGDVVLATIARCLARWDGGEHRGAWCVPARIGGEEFAMIVGGLEGFALMRFAEGVRREIAACDHGPAIAGRKVTVSIGIAEADAPGTEGGRGGGEVMGALYRSADASLYAAKRAGRDCVVVGEVVTGEAGLARDHARRVPGA